jgi:hypothetical protein
VRDDDRGNGHGGPADFGSGLKDGFHFCVLGVCTTEVPKKFPDRAAGGGGRQWGCLGGSRCSSCGGVQRSVWQWFIRHP